MEKHPHVEVFNFAITNNNEEQIFHITSHQQSSSLLPLKYHANVYPHIHETHTIKVPGRRLDDFLYSLKIDKSDYNFLVMDIQGAELMALEGAIETLKHIDGIALEVNFIELYEGCSLFNDIENFLDNHSFKHIVTAMGKQKSWGDSFFIRK